MPWFVFRYFCQLEFTRIDLKCNFTLAKIGLQITKLFTSVTYNWELAHSGADLHHHLLSIEQAAKDVMLTFVKDLSPLFIGELVIMSYRYAHSIITTICI